MPRDDAQMPDWYGALGVPETATAEEITAAFYALARRYHPDTSAAADPDSRRFKQIVQAYEVLSDPIQRRDYDRRRSGGRIPVGTRGPRTGPFRPTGVPGWDAAEAVHPPVIWADLPITPEEARWGGHCRLTLRRTIPCPSCAREDWERGGGCPVCQGRGYQNVAGQIGISIPRGCRTGQVLRYRLGDATGTHLCLRIRVRPSL